jgi:hypothetical protein
MVNIKLGVIIVVQVGFLIVLSVKNQHGWLSMEHTDILREYVNILEKENYESIRIWGLNQKEIIR